MGYQCLVCYERCRFPISCNRCKKLICKTHVSRIESKCPHCRLQPFQYTEEDSIAKLIANQIYCQREQLKKTQVFNCLVQGCKFQGKYHAMIKHKKKAHFNEKLEQTLYPQQRQNKKRRDALKSLIASRITKGPTKTFQRAFFIHAKTNGKCPLPELIKMVQHLQKCQNLACKRIVLTDHSAYLGSIDKKQSECQEGKLLISNF